MLVNVLQAGWWTDCRKLRWSSLTGEHVTWSPGTTASSLKTWSVLDWRAERLIPVRWGYFLNSFLNFLHAAGFNFNKTWLLFVCMWASGRQWRPPAVLQWGRGQVLCGWSDKLRAGVWTSSQARGVRQNQQVCRLAEESDIISCTQSEHETDPRSAQCCSNAALNKCYCCIHQTVWMFLALWISLDWVLTSLPVSQCH